LLAGSVPLASKLLQEIDARLAAIRHWSERVQERNHLGSYSTPGLKMHVRGARWVFVAGGDMTARFPSPTQFAVSA